MSATTDIQIANDARGAHSLRRFVRGHNHVTLYNADCDDVAWDKCDCIITDPPYPDIEKGFDQHPIDWLANLKCPQLIFWSAVCPFPLDWTARHVWHKPNGNSSQHYELIYERNGGKVCRVHRVAAILPNYVQFRRECENHPCQKPLKLIGDLINKMTKPGQTVGDPYSGSGTTAHACLNLGRNFVGAEKDPKHFATAVARLEREANQGALL